MRADLGRRLAALRAEQDVGARLAADPIRFPRRYSHARDVEIAAVVASGLAYGRVDLFAPVLERIFAIMDRAGGPYAYVMGFEPERDGGELRPIVYRWNRGVDFVLLFAALRAVIGRGSLADRFVWSAVDEDAGAAIERGVGAIRRAAVEIAGACGVRAAAFGELPRPSAGAPAELPGIPGRGGADEPQPPGQRRRPAAGSAIHAGGGHP